MNQTDKGCYFFEDDLTKFDESDEVFITNIVTQLQTIVTQLCIFSVNMYGKLSYLICDRKNPRTSFAVFRPAGLPGELGSSCRPDLSTNPRCS